MVTVLAPLAVYVFKELRLPAFNVGLHDTTVAYLVAFVAHFFAFEEDVGLEFKTSWVLAIDYDLADFQKGFIDLGV